MTSRSLTVTPLLGRIVAIIALFVNAAAALAQDPGDRRITLVDARTGEELSVVYWTEDELNQEALRDLDYFLRDTRNDEQRQMDPKLYDLLYDLAIVCDNPQGKFEIIRAYRSPLLDRTLRKRGQTISTTELHSQGKALDVRLLGTDSETLYEAALSLGRGGATLFAEDDYVRIDSSGAPPAE